MAKDNYNIDDILSEVKKRREETKSENDESAAASGVPDAPIEEAFPVENEAPQEDTPAVENSVPDAPSNDEQADSEPESVPPQEEKIPSGEENPEEGMLNIIEFAEDDSAEAEAETLPEEADDTEKNKKKKRNKTLTAVIIVLVLLIIAAVCVAGYIVNEKLNGIVNNSRNNVTITESEWNGMSVLDESFEPIQETEADELSSLEDMLKTWYYNGTPCYSSHVLNVLLIGEDTRDEEIATEETRADSAIIASVNIDTEEVTLTSVLRDTWAYWEMEPGNEETGTFDKINAAMLGGLGTYVNCIERLYKVRLDGYAIINFDSFEALIDALPNKSVTIDITSAEINEINNDPETYWNVYIEKTFEGNHGEVELSGEQVLAYCRIRHLDSDAVRADRQKTTLLQIYKETKDLGSTRQLQVINNVLPYMSVSFSKNDIIKIAKYALSQGWLGYDFQTQNLPEANVKGGNFGSEYLGQWVWKADFPADAYNLQTRLYGKSSITLAHRRVNVPEVRQKGYFKEGYPATQAVKINEHYGEVTVLEPLEKLGDDEEEKG